jgi:hypothetical protein
VRMSEARGRALLGNGGAQIPYEVRVQPGAKFQEKYIEITCTRTDVRIR